VVLAGAPRGRARDGARPAPAVPPQAVAPDRPAGDRGIDGTDGARPALPGDRRAVCGDRRGPGVAAVDRVAPVAAGVRGERRGGRGDPGGLLLSPEGSLARAPSWCRVGATSG
jgi:hypothetical protein